MEYTYYIEKSPLSDERTIFISKESPGHVFYTIAISNDRGSTWSKATIDDILDKFCYTLIRTKLSIKEFNEDVEDINAEVLTTILPFVLGEI